MGFPGSARSTRPSTRRCKWHELLAEFATLERVTGKMGFNAACAQAARMARDAIFQPEAREVPIQVMGVLESAGLEFDHLWVMGLTDEAWPMPARPNPFIPMRVQRAAGIPQADPVSSLELDRRITAGWLASAPRSRAEPSAHERRQRTRGQSAHRLGRAFPDREPARRRDHATLRGAIRAAGAMETVRGRGRRPRSLVTTQPAGPALFKDQAACPFRAFARRRLGAERARGAAPGARRRRSRHARPRDACRRMEVARHPGSPRWPQARPSWARSSRRARMKRSRYVRRYRADALAGRFARARA